MVLKITVRYQNTRHEKTLTRLEDLPDGSLVFKMRNKDHNCIFTRRDGVWEQVGERLLFKGFAELIFQELDKHLTNPPPSKPTSVEIPI